MTTQNTFSGFQPVELLQTDPCPLEPDMGLFDTLAGILKEADPQGTPVPYMLSAVTDARFFSLLGIQTYGFTPMQLPQDFSFTEAAHAADERIPVDAVRFGSDAIFKTFQRPYIRRGGSRWVWSYARIENAMLGL